MLPPSEATQGSIHDGNIATFSAPEPGRTYRSGSVSAVDEPIVRYCELRGIPVSRCPIQPTSWVEVWLEHYPTSPARCTNPTRSYGHERWVRVSGLSIWNQEVDVLDHHYGCADSWKKSHQRFRNQEFLLRPLLCKPAPNTVAHHWPTFVRAVPLGFSEHDENTTFSGACVAEGFLTKGYRIYQIRVSGGP